MLGTLETLPDGWEAHDIIVPLYAVADWRRGLDMLEDDPSDVSQGLCKILSHLKLRPASADDEVTCQFDGRKYVLSSGFACAIQPPEDYPRVHFVPNKMRVKRVEEGLFLLVSLSSHIDRFVHTADYGRIKHATQVLEGVRSWSHRRVLGLSLPRVHSAADFLRDDYANPGSAPTAGSTS